MQIKTTDKIWKNGQLIAWKDATVHVLTHGLHYGTGAFEGIRCYQTDKGPAVFRLHDHMVRLHTSAKAIQMKIPHTVDELCAGVKEVVKVNGLDSCYIRPISFFGVSGIGVNPMGYPVDTFIIAFPFGAYLGDEGLKNGIRVHTSSWHRASSGSVPATAKVCGDYLNSSLAIMEAKMNGFDETIMLNELHMVAEGSGENIFMVKDGKLYTPPANAGILPGHNARVRDEGRDRHGVRCRGAGTSRGASSTSQTSSSSPGRPPRSRPYARSTGGRSAREDRAPSPWRSRGSTWTSSGARSRRTRDGWTWSSDLG